MVVEQHAERAEDDHQQLEQAAVAADHGIADLVAVAGGTGDELARAVRLVVGRIERLDAIEQLQAQTGEQALAEQHRQDHGEVLGQAADQRQSDQQARPAPGAAGVEAAVRQAHHRRAMVHIAQRPAQHQLGQRHGGVDQRDDQADSDEQQQMPPVEGEAAQQRTAHADRSAAAAGGVRSGSRIFLVRARSRHARPRTARTIPRARAKWSRRAGCP